RFDSRRRSHVSIQVWTANGNSRVAWAEIKIKSACAAAWAAAWIISESRRKSNRHQLKSNPTSFQNFCTIRSQTPIARSRVVASSYATRAENTSSSSGDLDWDIENELFITTFRLNCLQCLKLLFLTRHKKVTGRA